MPDTTVQLDEKTELILRLAQQAIAEAIERHRRLGESIVIWRDGQIVTLTADEIPPQDLEAFKKEQP
jgi:hypothetical protein